MAWKNALTELNNAIITSFNNTIIIPFNNTIIIEIRTINKHTT